MIVGHEQVVRQLVDGLPPVSLFLGPRSVGKRTLANLLAEAHGYAVTPFKGLDMSQAREVSRLAQMGAEPSQLFIIEYDGRVRPEAMDTLLKALEEPAPSVRFIITATKMPPVTVASRAQIFNFTLLSSEEVEKILLRRNFSPSEAVRLAGVSRGQVMHALRLAKSASQEKVPVLQVLRALRERDEDVLSAQVSRWTDEHTALLTTACHEILTTRWRVFQLAEVEGTSKKLALRILSAIRDDVRPRLVIHASLMTILKENR